MAQELHPEEPLSFYIRADSGRTHVTVSNVKQIPGKERKCRQVLQDEVEKKMIFWEDVSGLEPQKKADAKNPEKEVPAIFADVWTMDGKHISTALVKSSCAEQTTQFPNPNVDPINPNIFRVKADEEKE